MLSAASRRSDGRLAVPGNRWDLVDPSRVEAPEVSVVIPYYDGPDDLALILGALTRQTHPRSRLQVVVADDGSSVPPRIPDAAADLGVVVVRQDDRGFRAAAARNLGVAASDGQVLVLLDGDTVPEPGYVAAMARLPAVLPDAVVGGRRRYAELAGWTADRLQSWFTGDGPAPELLPEPEWLLREYRASGDLLRVGPRSYQHLIGAVLGCSREMFDDIGGFDETFVGYGGEDYDFTYRAHTAGAVFGYVPDAVAWHSGPDWSGRTPDPDAQRAQKNREIGELARRIPEPTLRGSGQVYPVPDVVVEADAAGWALGSAVVCVRSLLAGVDSGVWLHGASPELVAWFADDPRVHPGTPTAAVTDRARVRVAVGVPVRADAGLAVAQEPEMTQQYRGLPSPFIYRPTTGDGASQPLSDRDERALLDDAALNAYRNSAGSSQPRYSSADQQSIRRVPPPPIVTALRPAPDVDDADSGDEASSESDTVEQHHVVPGSPDASATPLPGPHQTLAVRAPPPVSPTSASSPLSDDVSATSSRADSVRRSGMHPGPISPSLSPEQIAILRRNLHDKQDLSDDESDDYARSDPSGLQVRFPCSSDCR